MSNEIAYNIIRRAMYDGVFLQGLMNNMDNVIQNEGLTDQNEMIQLKQILTSLINAAKQTTAVQQIILGQLKSTMETADAFKTGLRDTVKQIEEGYNSVMMMYKIAFYLGVALIIFSLFFAIWKKESLIPIIFGGLGIADFMVYFFTKPPQEIQNSRANLAQLQSAYFNWFVDIYNWNAYLGHLTQTNQINFQNVKDVSDALLHNTDKTMELIEKYCELTKK